MFSTIHDEDGDPNAEEGDPCDILEAHVASQAHELIFGDKTTNQKGSSKSISEAAAKRDAPGISVFVVSSNPTMEHKICHMFQGVPAKIFKLRNTDFFTAEQGVYPTMGVDRVAALYGAKLHYGAPALVIDGGTAMTYTMLDSQGIIRGGGISPGVKIRLQSLADYTGSLPIIDHIQFKKAVEGAIAAKTPLPFFAKDTVTAMISPVCAELSCQLRNIIKQYASKCKSPSPAPENAVPSIKKPSRRLPVVITGGDGKFIKDLLQTDASGIIPVEPEATPVQEHAIEIRHVKNLVTYALGDVLYEKFSQKRRNDSEEKLKLKIMGLRIAAPAIHQKELFSRGCIFNITPESMIEGYIFHAHFDNGIQKDLTLKELYDALVLYNEIGERAEKKGADGLDVEDDWVTEKKLWSQKVQEELGNRSRLIRNRMRELKPHMEKGELAELFKTWSSTESRLRTNPKKAKLSKFLIKPNEVIGKRLAKRFPIDVDGKTIDQIFFGTVKYISDQKMQWYFVCYDDGDAEDLGIDEVRDAIHLYQVHKFDDPLHKDDTENTTSTAKAVPSKKVSSSFPSFAVVEEEAMAYTDLSTLLGMPTASDSNAAEGSTDRIISEFKEDI